MVDVNTQFGGFLTALGAAQDANSKALGIPWKLTHMLIGDANGADPVPAPGQTALVNQVYRAQLNQLYVSPTDANVLIAELVLPPNVGGWWIRELALEDEDGVFSAVANCAPSYKPVLAQGSGRNQVVRMHVITSGTANIQLKIDPSVVLATRAYCDGLIAAHGAAANPHPQYTTEEEVNQLISTLMNSWVQPLSLGGTGAKTAEQALLNLGGAPIESPDLSGKPTAPTAAPGTNTEQIANTAFVHAGMAGKLDIAVPYVPDLNAAVTGPFLSTPASIGSPDDAVGRIWGFTFLDDSKTDSRAQMAIDDSSALFLRSFDGVAWSGWTKLAPPNEAKAAKAWVNFNGTGLVAIRSSHNVSSIADNGVGDYTVNLAKAMPNTDYAAVTSGALNDAAITGINCAKAYARTLSSFKVGTTSTSTASVDFLHVDAAVYSN